MLASRIFEQALILDNFDEIELEDVCLGDIAEISNGYSYRGKELENSKNAMATIKNFDRTGGFKVDGYKELIISERVKPHHYLRLFDVVVAHTDLTQNAEIIGNAEMILDSAGYENLIASMDLVKVNSKESYINNALLLQILKRYEFKAHALSYVNGTTVLHLGKKALPEYVLRLPKDKEMLKKLSDDLLSIYKEASTHMVENRKLINLRDILLPRLMSGEINLTNIDC